MMIQWELHGLAVGSEMGGKRACYMLGESRKALRTVIWTEIYWKQES